MQKFKHLALESFLNAVLVLLSCLSPCFILRLETLKGGVIASLLIVILVKVFACKKLQKIIIRWLSYSKKW